MSRLTRDGAAEPVSRYQILRRVRGQGNIHFPYSAELEQDWQPYPVDPYSAIIICNVINGHTYIHTYIHTYWGAQGTLSLSKNCTSRESVSPLSRLIRGFRNKYH